MRQKHFDFGKQKHKLNFLEKQMSLVLDYRNCAAFPLQYQQLSIQFISIIIQSLNQLTEYISDQFYGKVDQIAIQFTKTSKAYKRFLFRQSILGCQKENIQLQSILENDEINQFLSKRRTFQRVIEVKTKYLEPDKKKQSIINELTTYCQQFKGSKRKPNPIYKADKACGTDNFNIACTDQHVQTIDNPINCQKQQFQTEYFKNRKKSVEQRINTYSNKSKIRNSLNVSPIRKLHTTQTTASPINFELLTPKMLKRRQLLETSSSLITKKTTPKIDSNIRKYIRESNVKWQNLKINQNIKDRFSIGSIKQRNNQLPTVMQHS